MRRQPGAGSVVCKTEKKPALKLNGLPEELILHTESPSGELNKAVFIFNLPGFIKPLLYSVLLLLWFGVPDASQAESIKFVYIHGTNQNTPQSQQHFNQEVAGLHPEIIKALEKEPLAKRHLLENGRLSIDPKSLNFFWGDKSHLAIEAVRRNIFIPQFNRGFLKLGERARQKVAFTLHDAVWVEQQTNKKEIIAGLFDAVFKTGDQPIMLMGHSAGSLVTFDFLMYRLPYIDPQDFASDLHVAPEVMEKIKQNGASHTCLEALLASSGIRYDTHGRLAPFFSEIEPKLPPELLSLYRTQWIVGMPGFTKQYCLPESKVRGLVTFGSPLALFYSLAANPQKDESYLVASMVYYILSHNMVWLHVNHWDDIIALPLPDKQRFLSVMQNRLKKPAVLNGGFIENYIYAGSGANFINAHGWYWRKPKKFAGAVAKAYHIGYQTWYPNES